MAKLKDYILKSKKYILILEDDSELIIKRNDLKTDLWELQSTDLKKDDVKLVDKILSIEPDLFNNLCKQIQKVFGKKIKNIM